MHEFRIREFCSDWCTDFSLGGNFWLKRWSEVNGEEGMNPDVGKFIGVYFAFGISSSTAVVVQTLILWIFCSIEVSNLNVLNGCILQYPSTWQKLRSFSTGIQKASWANGICDIQIANELFWNVWPLSPLTCVNRGLLMCFSTPAGRILNRFSRCVTLLSTFRSPNTAWISITSIFSIYWGLRPGRPEIVFGYGRVCVALAYLKEMRG